MKLGYLHLGEERHGIQRYGRMLAEAVRRSGAVEVIEQRVLLGGGRRADRDALRRAAAALNDADLVHLQYNRAIWGGGWSQILALRAFLAACTTRLAVTLHDVYPDDPWRAWRKQPASLDKRLRRRLRGLLRQAPGNRAVKLLLERCEAVLVCFEIERRRLLEFPHADRLHVIGHFVEPRGGLPDRAAARRALGVADRRVVTVLGYIHPRKGYDLVVAALPKLPPDVLVVFAGMASPGNEKALARWQRKARKKGQAHRLLVTGYLAEDEQARWLVASDLGVCPFRFFSASGSMTTWISAGRPVLCHALPQIEEYRAISPGAFFTFAPYTVEAFVQAVEAALARVDGAADPKILALAEHFALEQVARRHLDLFFGTGGAAAAPRPSL